MKVKFLKDHVHYKKDDVVDANKGMAEYWIRVKVAEALPGETREEQLAKMKKPELEKELLDLTLNPNDYSNNAARIEAILAEEAKEQ